MPRDVCVKESNTVAENTPVELREKLICSVYVRNHTPEGTFRADADDLNDIAVCLRYDGKKKKLGVFSMKGKSAEVEVPLKDGNYVNLITDEPVEIRGGKLRCEGEPVILTE